MEKILSHQLLIFFVNKRSSPVLQRVRIGFTNSPPTATSLQKGQLEIIVLRENCKENGWLDLPFIVQSIQKQQSARHGHIYTIYNHKTINSPHSVSHKFIMQSNCCSFCGKWEVPLVVVHTCQST